MLTRKSQQVEPAAFTGPLLFVIVILLQPWIVLSQLSEQSLLYDFYTSTSGWASNCSGGWRSNTTPVCIGRNTNWTGVVCSGGRVIQIALSSCNIHGTLPSQWSSLAQLVLLRLDSNFLSGTLPLQWSNMTSMQIMRLAANSLSGTLPSQWSKMGNMRRLFMGSNSLSGTLPPQWSSFSNMSDLHLDSNFFSGTLPPEWSSLASLMSMNVSINTISGVLPSQWSALSNAVVCLVWDNCLNTSNATAWWRGVLRSFAFQRPAKCLASIGRNDSRGVTFSVSTSSRLSATGGLLSRSIPISSDVSATNSLQAHESSSLSPSLLISATLSNSEAMSRWSLCLSVTSASILTSKVQLPTSKVPQQSVKSRSVSTPAPALSETLTWSSSLPATTKTNELHSTTLVASKATTVRVMTSLCDAPLSINSSLRVVSTRNASLCRAHVCPATSPARDSGGSVTLNVAYDDMNAAASMLLLLANVGNISQWLSLLPSARMANHWLDTAPEVAQPDGAFGLVLQRPGTGWPDIAEQPYATQRIMLLVSLRCSGNSGIVASSIEMVLVVKPRAWPVVASVQPAMQGLQVLAGALGGGVEALVVGRLIISLSMLSCDDVLQGDGVGLSMVSVSGDMLSAVDTIVGNIVMATIAAAATGVAACCLFLCASSRCPWMACCRDVLRLPLSLFPVFAATLPSTVMAIVAVLRDAPTLTRSVASGAIGSIAVAAVLWGGALVLVVAATRRMHLTATLRPNCAVPSAADLGTRSCYCGPTLRWAFWSSAEWITEEPSDASLVEGTTVVWFLPLDVFTTVVIAAVSALPLSHSTALCIGANAVNVAGSAVMLAVVVVRRPFTTAFGRVHSAVTSIMALALAICGLVLVALLHDDHSMLLTVSYLGLGVTVLCDLKAVVDAVAAVAATRDRFHRLLVFLSHSPGVLEETLRDTLIVVDQIVDDGPVVLLPLLTDVEPNVEVDSTSSEDTLCLDKPFLRDEVDPRLLHPLGDLLDAYQCLVADDTIGCLIGGDNTT